MVDVIWTHLRSCDPCNFRGETLDMILLPLENFGGNEHRERRVLHAHGFDFLVEPI